MDNNNNNNNKQELGVKKYYTEPERIYYHCTSLRRLLKERKDIELLQSLENSLRQQNLFKDKEKKEGCYRCGDKSHWIKDCNQPENYKKKATLWRVFIIATHPVTGYLTVHILKKLFRMKTCHQHHHNRSRRRHLLHQ